MSIETKKAALAKFDEAITRLSTPWESSRNQLDAIQFALHTYLSYGAQRIAEDIAEEMGG